MSDDHKRRPPRSWFVPNPNYTGPPIVLEHGRWTKSGRFVPRNVTLTRGLGRLSKKPRRRIRMVGYPYDTDQEIYAAHMREKSER